MDVLTVYRKPTDSLWYWAAPGRWNCPRDAIVGPCRDQWRPMTHGEAAQLEALPLEPGEYIEVKAIADYTALENDG